MKVRRIYSSGTNKRYLHVTFILWATCKNVVPREWRSGAEYDGCSALAEDGKWTILVVCKDSRQVEKQGSKQEWCLNSD